ncbi:Atrophin-1 multi-domain protein [Roseateles sp. L2-2]|uniref:Atrophin-1 multi-domain protein n=1 Tax=Roseateles sp. L2-2 TaxID=3422597 RepID=UPI003D3618EE
MLTIRSVTFRAISCLLSGAFVVAAGATATAAVAAPQAAERGARADASEKNDPQARAVRQLRFGTPDRPFAADSPWNARPIGVTLGTDEIPKAKNYPTLEDGKWSTGVFVASPDDKPVTVLPLPGRKGIWDPDAEAMRDQITIPRWPAGVEPASAADGHGDIVDPVDRVIHSFNVLRFIDGQWRADQYAWTKLDGRGWGEPGHYFQGARAAAVPTMGGLVRAKEIDDNDEVFRHALAMSLTHTGLSPDPAYIYPATSADTGAKSNTGKVPQGALMMLPPDFDTERIKDALLRKVARTLKVYGAYVVDRNVETPYVIYVEMGANKSLMKRGWHPEFAYELDRVRAGLRQVMSVDRWVDGNGKPMSMEAPQNRFSLRGPWKRSGGGSDAAMKSMANAPSGTAAAAGGDRAGAGFDTRRQAVVFPAGEGVTVLVNDSGRSLQPVNWAKPEAGKRYKLTATATGGAKLQLQLLDAGRRTTLFDSGELADGASKTFEWPEGQGAVRVTVRSGPGPGESSVGGALVPVEAENAKDGSKDNASDKSDKSEKSDKSDKSDRTRAKTQDKASPGSAR